MGTFFGQKTRLMGREVRYNVRPRSDPGPANVRSVVGAAALGHTFLPVLRVSPIGNIPLILNANAILIMGASWRSAEPSNSAMFFQISKTGQTRASTFSLQKVRLELQRVQNFGSQIL